MGGNMHKLLGEVCSVERSAVMQGGNGDSVLFPGNIVRIMKSQPCREDMCHVWLLLIQITSRLKHIGGFFSTDSFKTLVYEWFTAKRNALWISLLFNLSQRPLKTGSNALISYSEERLIYRYACHLLLPIFINKATHCHWCLNQKLQAYTSSSRRSFSRGIR